MRIAKVILAITLLTVIFPSVLAANPSKSYTLVYEGRVFLEAYDNETVPLEMESFGGHFIAILAYTQNGTAVYIYNVTSSKVEASYTFENWIPLCMGKYGDSLDIIVGRNGAIIKEYLVTPKLEIVDGFETTTNRSMFLSGCAAYEGRYYIYGSTPVSSHGLDAYLIILNSAGRIIEDYVWGTPNGMESMFGIQKTGNELYGIAVNASAAGQFYLLKIVNNDFKLVKEFDKLKVINLGCTESNEVILIVRGINVTANSLLIYNLSTDKGKIITFSIKEGNPLAAYRLSKNIAVIAGYRINSTSGLKDGSIMIIDTANGNVLTANYAFGKRDTTYLVVLPVDSTIYVAGIYGNTPTLVKYHIEEYNKPTTTSVETPTPSKQANSNVKLFIVIIVIIVILATVILYYRRRPTPS